MDGLIVIDLSDTLEGGIHLAEGWEAEWNPSVDWIEEISLRVQEDMNNARKAGWKQSLSRIKFHASGPRYEYRR